MKNGDCTHFLWGTASVDGWVHKDPSEFEIILNTKLQLGYSNSTFTRYLSENANVHLSSRTIRQVERLQFWKIWTFKFQPNPLEPLLSAGLWLDASQNNNKGHKKWSRLDEEGENLIPSHWRFANDHDAFPCNMRGRRYDSWWLHSQVWSAGFIWISECSLNVWWRWCRIDASHKWAKRSGKQNDELMETYKQLKDGSTHERRKNWWANHQRSPEGNSHSAKIHLAFMPLRRSKLDVLFM